MEKAQDIILSAKNKVTDSLPSPPPFQTHSSPRALKERLEWGEPALTIIDVRDRNEFNQEHILGAMPMPVDELVERAEPTIAKSRDIYLYGSHSDESARAAESLRSVGFTNVAQIEGGLEAWKAISGSTDGSKVISNPGAEAYNVGARMAHHNANQ